MLNNSSPTAACGTPPGWYYNPSEWSQRLPGLVLALTGFGIATYLSLYQLGVIPVVWEPIFGDGSHRILKESTIAHLLPIPDAALGAVVYFIDGMINTIGGRTRWRTMPWIVLLLGAISGTLAVGGIVLSIAQPTLFHGYCTLCLASATCSVLMIGFVIGEVLATLQFLKREQKQGHSWWNTVLGQRGGQMATSFISPTTRGSVRYSVILQVVGAALGIWLMAAPTVLDYGDAARTNDRIMGPLVVASALIALHEVARPLRWVNLAIGMSLLFAPWVFSYRLTAILNDTAIGVLLVCCSLVRCEHWQQLGGGWSCLWNQTFVQPGD